MPQYNVPVESMRAGGLPVGWDENDREAEERRRYRPYRDDGTPNIISLGGGFYLGPGASRPRRCHCGAEIMTGSRADRAHVAGCGPPDESG